MTNQNNNNQQIQQPVTKQMVMRKIMEKEAKQALTLLRKSATQRNTINVREFVNKYGILFKNIDLDNIDIETRTKIEHASKELLSNIDPYTPITLVDDNGNKVVTFPPIFYPVNELDESVSSTIDRLRSSINQYFTPGQIDSIYSGLLASMIQSQLTPEEQEALANGTLTLKDIFESKTEQLVQLFISATQTIREAKEQAEIDQNDNGEEQPSDLSSSFSLLEDSEANEFTEDTGSAFILLIDSTEN